MQWLHIYVDILGFEFFYCDNSICFNLKQITDHLWKKKIKKRSNELIWYWKLIQCKGSYIPVLWHQQTLYSLHFPPLCRASPAFSCTDMLPARAWLNCPSHINNTWVGCYVSGDLLILFFFAADVISRISATQERLWQRLTQSKTVTNEKAHWKSIKIQVSENLL